jgi:UDP-N-acetylmuramoylalanine--D-glutamate ligase
MNSHNTDTSVWQQFCSDFGGRDVALFGLGRQGGGAKVANTFLRAGAKVTVFDSLSEQELQESISQLESGIQLELGTTHPDFTSYEVVIKNPAVPFTHPAVQNALAAHIPVVGETALAVQYLRDRCVGITGTRGKTTTTTLIGELLRTAGLSVVVGGNIPQSPALSLLEQCTPETWAVLEISSFQLESFMVTEASPHIAVVTNVYPDHLNRYANIDEYAQTKAEIFRFQLPGDVAIFGGLENWHSTFEAAIQTEIQKNKVDQSILEKVKVDYISHLPGEHNWENIATVELVRQALNIPQETLQATLDHFTGVPYRLQEVRILEGIRFINDTTSTTPVALERALGAYEPRSFVLIAGGATKHLPLENSLLEKLATTPSAIFLLEGSGSQELLARMNESSFEFPPLEIHRDLAGCVQAAYKYAQEKGVHTVLFSPGFTSFEMFNNEFDRGDHFNRYVAEL